MAPMTTNGLHLIASQPAPPAGESGWAGVYARLCALALARAAAMAAGDAEDDADFDRGARAIRALMSAAEIARRLKDQDAEDKDIHARNATPAVSDERIRTLKARLNAQIDRLEAGEGETPERGDAS